ncbi:MAG: transglycosylase SLT domain-containing protein [bacterium]
MGFKESVKFILGIDDRKNKSVNHYKDDSFDESKRNFLKFGAGVAATTVVGTTAFKGLDYVLKSFAPKNAIKETADTDEFEDEVETVDQKEIAEHDAKSLDEIVNLRVRGKINLTPQKMKQIEHYWLNQYSVGKLHKGLTDAYRNMGEWRPYLEAAFKQEFDHDFLNRYGQANYDKAISLIYLAIPESHWNITAVSRTKAVGPYQFMKGTASSEKIGLRMRGGIDERKDPVKSGHACAKVLKELFVASGDWDLTLSGYNGGFIWGYLKECKNTNQKPSYNQFVEFLEKKINTVKVKIETAPNLTLAQKEAVFAKTTMGFSENLNYPAKFNAVLALIKEGAVTEQKNPLHFREVKVNNPHPKHEKVAKHKGRKVQAKVPYTLKHLSVQKKVPLEHLVKLNPAIDPNAELLNNYIIRV